jgi:hypothetical protein
VRTLAALLFAFVTALATVAGGSPRRIAILEPDDELVRAVTLSLSPWGVETTRSEATPPELSHADAVEVATQLARRLNVEAMIWISRAEEATLLWVFDAHSGNVTARRLSEAPPFDGAAAAAVALSVKTVLRTSSVAPPDERLGPEPAPPSSNHPLALELGGGGHWIGARALEARFELAAVAWLVFQRRVGVGLELSAGPGVSVADERFRGRYRELVAGGELRLRPLREPPLSVAVSLGGALHWTRLEGTLAASSLYREVARRNATLDAEVLVSLDIGGGAYLGVSAGLSYAPAYRRYLVEGNPVFSPLPLSSNLAGHIGVGLF